MKAGDKITVDGFEGVVQGVRADGKAYCVWFGWMKKGTWEWVPINPQPVDLHAYRRYRVPDYIDGWWLWDQIMEEQSSTRSWAQALRSAWVRGRDLLFTSLAQPPWTGTEAAHGIAV